jgi:hypothetical protein
MWNLQVQVISNCKNIFLPDVYVEMQTYKANDFNRGKTLEIRFLKENPFRMYWIWVEPISFLWWFRKYISEK